MQANIDYICGSQVVDCGPIQPEGACYEPNTISSHAAFAMNLYYQKFGRNPWNCDFSQTAMLTSQNPSKFNFLTPPLFFSEIFVYEAIYSLVSYLQMPRT